MSHNIAKRQFYALSRNPCDFEDVFSEITHIIAAPVAGSPLFPEGGGCVEKDR